MKYRGNVKRRNSDTPRFIIECPQLIIAEGLKLRSKSDRSLFWALMPQTIGHKGRRAVDNVTDEMLMADANLGTRQYRLSMKNLTRLGLVDYTRTGLDKPIVSLAHRLFNEEAKTIYGIPQAIFRIAIDIDSNHADKLLMAVVLHTMAWGGKTSTSDIRSKQMMATAHLNRTEYYKSISLLNAGKRMLIYTPGCNLSKRNPTFELNPGLFELAADTKAIQRRIERMGKTNTCISLTKATEMVTPENNEVSTNTRISLTKATEMVTSEDRFGTKGITEADSVPTNDRNGYTSTTEMVTSEDRFGDSNYNSNIDNSNIEDNTNNNIKTNLEFVTSLKATTLGVIVEPNKPLTRPDAALAAGPVARPRYPDFTDKGIYVDREASSTSPARYLWKEQVIHKMIADNPDRYLWIPEVSPSPAVAAPKAKAFSFDGCKTAGDCISKKQVPKIDLDYVSTIRTSK